MDQLRADGLGVTGGWVRTPNIDRLAESGILFEQVYANSAECVPARFSLATGLYPHQTGVDVNRRATLNPAVPTWSRIAADAGYRTSVFGKTHLHPHEGDLRERTALLHAQGFQEVHEVTGPRASAEAASEMTDAWEERGELDRYREDVKQRFAIKPHLVRPSTLPLDLYYDVYVGTRARNHLAQQTTGRPWICWVSFPGPHEPWDAPEPYASMYRPEDMPPPLPQIQGRFEEGLLHRSIASAKQRPTLEPGDVARMRANYAGNVTLIDDQIGDILTTLRSTGELDRTMIVVTSDHGELNGDHGFIYKSNFLDASVRVPLLIRPPGGTDPRRSSALVELMDVAATIADAAEPGAQLGHARSLREILGGDTQHRDVVYAEFDRHTMYVDADWKAELTPRGTVSMLVDRRNDPHEQHSLVGDRTEGVQNRIVQSVARFKESTPAPALSPELPDSAPTVRVPHQDKP
jgi:arylsulfatase